MGERRRLDPTTDVELAQDARDVDARGLGAHEQLGADLAVGVAGGDEAEYVALPGSEVEAVRAAPVRGVAEFDTAAPRQRADLVPPRPGAEPGLCGRSYPERLVGDVTATTR